VHGRMTSVVLFNKQLVRCTTTIMHVGEQPDHKDTTLCHNSTPRESSDAATMCLAVHIHNTECRAVWIACIQRPKLSLISAGTILHSTEMQGLLCPAHTLQTSWPWLTIESGNRALPTSLNSKRKQPTGRLLAKARHQAMLPHSCPVPRMQAPVHAAGTATGRSNQVVCSFVTAISHTGACKEKRFRHICRFVFYDIILLVIL
jgi:hypothetical protein